MGADGFFAGEYVAGIGFQGYFAVAGDVVQMVADAFHAFGIAASAFGDFDHDFWVFFGGGAQVGQGCALFQRFGASAAKRTFALAVYGAGVVLEKPFVQVFIRHDVFFLFGLYGKRQPETVSVSGCLEGWMRLAVPLLSVCADNVACFGDVAADDVFQVGNHAGRQRRALACVQAVGYLVQVAANSGKLGVGLV